MILCLFLPVLVSCKSRTLRKLPMQLFIFSTSRIRTLDRCWNPVPALEDNFTLFTAIRLTHIILYQSSYVDFLCWICVLWNSSDFRRCVFQNAFKSNATFEVIILQLALSTAIVRSRNEQRNPENHWERLSQQWLFIMRRHHFCQFFELDC